MITCLGDAELSVIHEYVVNGAVQIAVFEHCHAIIVVGIAHLLNGILDVLISGAR